jgi:colanic acid/amylovoran biosynthesis protein
MRNSLADSHQKKILLMGATFGTNNLGVSALTAGTIEACLHVWPHSTIILLDYDQKPFIFHYNSVNGPVTVELVNMRFSKKFSTNNIAFLILLSSILRMMPRPIKRVMSARNRCLDAISNVDVAVSISGGDSFSDIYGIERLLYVSMPQILVELNAKKTVLLPQTIGPFGTHLARMLARHILRRAALVYSREYAGLQEMRDFLGKDFDTVRFRFCYDLGFVVNPTLPQNMDLDGFAVRGSNYPTVGLNVSGLLWIGGYTKNNQFGLKTDYPVLIENLIDRLIREKKATVLLIPHVFGKAAESESDQTVSEKLYRTLKPKYGQKIFFAKGGYDQSEIKYIIGLCDFFIGSRMHACIAALSQCIPTVPIAYSKKFIGVMETIGVARCVVDLRTMEESEILSAIGRVWGERNHIGKMLESKIPEVKARILNLFFEINEAL